MDIGEAAALDIRLKEYVKEIMAANQKKVSTLHPFTPLLLSFRRSSFL